MTTTPLQKPLNKAGRKPKGGIQRVVLPPARVIPAYSEVFARKAHALGLPMTDYIALRLCEAEGLDIPPYILDEMERARRERENDLQEPLMAG